MAVHRPIDVAWGYLHCTPTRVGTPHAFLPCEQTLSTQCDSRAVTPRWEERAFPNAMRPYATG
jgi:hypothetical protein